MIPHIIHKPPAPAPPWVNKPLIPESPEPVSGLYFYPLIFIAIIAGIAISYKFWRSHLQTNRLKMEEIKLRNQIKEYLGPESQWFSAEEIGKRFHGLAEKPENCQWMIEELHKIERLRFME